MHELIGIAKREGCKGAVLDNDATICSSNFGKGIGYEFLKREFKKGHINNILEGLYDVLKIKMSAIKNGEEENIRSQKILFQGLGRTGCADRGSAYVYAERHRKRKELEGIGKFIKDFQNEVGPVFVSTQGSSRGADVVRYAYDLAGSASNPVIYLTTDNQSVADIPIAYNDHIGNQLLNADSLIIDCDNLFRNAKDKKDGAQKMLEGHESRLDLGEMLAIGDKHSIDSEVMNKSLLSASSPLADKKTKKEAHYKIASYVS
jgi:hypothetical protein